MTSARNIARQIQQRLKDDWSSHARPEQLAPAGDAWSIWLYLAGRGAGKTRSGVEWILSQKDSHGRIALCAPTAADARDVLCEGPSGIMSCCPNYDRPLYEPSKRRITWKNGAVASIFSAEEPDRLRGPQHELALCDELAAGANPQACWDMLMFGLRMGKNPRVCITTTPRPTKIIRDLVAREGKDVVITRGRTADNAANLAPQFLNTIVSRYQGTRLGRQELDAEVLTDIEGALWTLDLIESCRVEHAPALKRIVIGVDPAASTGENSDETGIPSGQESPVATNTPLAAIGRV
jgi:phage terminase large subunit-like protein